MVKKKHTSKVDLSASGAPDKVARHSKISPCAVCFVKNVYAGEKNVTLVVKYSSEEVDLLNSSELG